MRPEWVHVAVTVLSCRGIRVDRLPTEALLATREGPHRFGILLHVFQKLNGLWMTTIRLLDGTSSTLFRRICYVLCGPYRHGVGLDRGEWQWIID
jgi:hypothetical protein